MKVLHKKLMRDILRAKGQAFAVAMVICCGAASYITVASSYRNLLLTRDSYYAQYRFEDFSILLEQAPETAAFRVEAIPGVRQARGRIVEDVNVDIEGQKGQRTGRIVSMPDHDEDVIDDIVVLSGRYFDKGASNEVILSDAFATANGLEVGDRIQATINNRKQTLRIIGTALSPEYVYMIRNARDFFPKPERFGIMWVPETWAEMAFDMSAAVNNIVGLVEDPEDLDAVLDSAEKLLDAYGVYATVKGEDQISNRLLSDEIAGLGVSARIIPSIFLGIAALILLVLLNRMVRQERTQIGLLKAFGHSNWTVGGHYVKFALALGVVGCLLGIVVGQYLSQQIIQMYVQFFQFPVLRARVYPDVLANAMAITVAFAMVGAISAARRAAKIDPAESMRPEAPRHGHRTLIERAGILWRNLSFTWKMIVRNVGRYRIRAAITVFGVMISAGIMIVGFFSMDSMEYMISYQFEEAQRDDVKINLAREMGKDALFEIQRLPYVRRAEPLLQYPFEVRSAWHKKDVSVTGMPRDATMMVYTDAQGRRMDVGDSGIVLSESVAEDLGVTPGDILTLKPLQGRITDERRVPVRQVVEQYLGAGAYMNIHALSEVLDESLAFNAALVRTETGREQAVSVELKDYPGVATVEVKEESLQALRNTLQESFSISNQILAIFAGVIAFAIIYNSTIVSLTERQRELASLRVMGFSIGEVGRILYNENFLLSAIGLVLGIPFGMAQSWLIVRAYDTELYRLPFYISSTTFWRTGAFIVVFVVLANLAARRKIHTLDMVEVLKERE